MSTVLEVWVNSYGVLELWKGEQETWGIEDEEDYSGLLEIPEFGGWGRERRP